MRAIRRLVLALTAVLALGAGSFAGAVGGFAAGTARPDTAGPGRPDLAQANAPSAAIQPDGAGACGGTFEDVAATTNRGPASINNLVGVAALAPDVVWAVGFNIGANGYHKTLAEIWNGTAWNTIFTPNPGSFYNDFKGVSAVTPTDIWTVGTYTINSSNKAATFAEHWNGTNWRVFRTPNGPSNAFSNLFGVSAVAGNDVWAVGQYIGPTFFNRTLIEHWDGSSWQIVPSPNASAFNNQLLGVAAFSPTDVWAVGYYRAAPAPSPRRSLAEHWNGTSWTIVPGTFSTPGDTEINGVAALAGGQAVAVGYGRQAQGAPQAALQFDLSTVGPQRAFQVSSPGSDTDLYAVSEASGQVWAVGSWRLNNSGPHLTFVASAFYTSGSLPQLTGGTSASPGTTSTGSVLFAVSAISATGFWAAGTATNDAIGVDQTLAELWCRPHLDLSAPASTQAGAAFSLTVTATNLDDSPATGYLGTVHFTSTDPQAQLPGDYQFAPADGGSQTFAGVQLQTLNSQSITATDTIEPEVSGSATVLVSCLGTCQVPAATPGDRGTRQAPPTSPPPRSSAPGTAAAPGPKTAASPPKTVAPKRATPIAASTRPKSGSVFLTTRSGMAPIATRRTSSPSIAGHAVSSVIRTAVIGSPAPVPAPWYALLLLSVLAALALFARLLQPRS